MRAAVLTEPGRIAVREVPAPADGGRALVRVAQASLCAGRRLDLAPLVTARFPLARAGDALRAARDPAQLKIIIDVA